MKKSKIDWADVGMTVTGILFALFMIALMIGIILIGKHSADHTRLENGIAISDHILETPDGNQWEVERTLAIGHTYEVYLNDNDTSNNVLDDYIICVK